MAQLLPLGLQREVKMRTLRVKPQQKEDEVKSRKTHDLIMQSGAIALQGGLTWNWFSVYFQFALQIDYFQ